ncbi:MAG: LPS export ABC transporter periplasmic protein LptC, partial [Planctomycetes bacterium]|nr:LPS export ABC transporter periplasmic protein LptC [Planctomycetota bacterium]
MRKFVIGFISLAAVLVIYLLFSRLNKTPPIDTGAGAEFADAVADSNLGGFDSKVGLLGEIGVETIQKARFITLNKNQEVEREWGFERLVHKIRDIWEIEKPYMNIYRRNFKCYITADIGNVQVETAVGKSTPKDATFTGNVVVHILPEGSSNIKESHIYLDDIIFLSEKSQLSTANSVKFVSEDTRMLGTGMELVYDDE